ncbi:MAG: helix-turn-helix transcriptional regulator [Lachnospiraceae bacterium]|nr:helix-turn-helix transcriptional regulator [Lachnospiraceae bacterium]
MKGIGDILANLRKEKVLGQKEMASLLNLSVGTISNYENGVHSPDLDTLCRLAEFFGVTTDYLLGRTEYRCPPEVLNCYVALDYTAQDIVNTVLSLDEGAQATVVDFVKYMQHLHRQT